MRFLGLLDSLNWTWEQATINFDFMNKMSPKEPFKLTMEILSSKSCIHAYDLSNALATFESATNDILGPYLWKFAVVFIDDILIYSHTMTEHVAHMEWNKCSQSCNSMALS